MTRRHRTAKPRGARWATARLIYADLTTAYLRGINQRLPLAGGRLLWAVVGRKWVRCCAPVCNTKFKLRRSEWDQIPTREIRS